MFDWQRKAVVVDRRMQLRVALDLFLQMAIAAILLACIVYLDPLPTLFGGYSLERHQAAVEELWQVNRGSWPLFLAAAAVLLFFSFIWSNRLAGPVYRLRKMLEAAGQGDFRQDPALRRMDYFQDLLPPARQFLGRHREDIRHLRGELAILEKNLGQRSDLPPEVRRAMDEMHNILTLQRLGDEP